ncbi:facilitated trehalose transporter Tret1-like [Leptopilina heterotoma]|uniref:facilitated trehalose transporter Tret1-like n=1 Tax=Leptopilina heterotoma TaxID=63436 RepID=UPI001CA9A64A|nr:facilitated trehalose transporter Tret1-like [Leptopilina heterotoma]
MISCATYRSWPSPSLLYLKSEKSEFHVTDVEGSWIVSLYSIGDFVGCLFSPSLVDRIGRKYTLLVFAIPSLIGCLLITTANNVNYLFVGRFIGGIGHGGIFNLIVIYVSEISEKNIRGILMNIMNIASNIGTCIFTAIGAYLSYQIYNITSITIPILFLATFIFMPESPYFLLMKNRDNDAMASIMKLRGVRNQKSIESELTSIKLSITSFRNQKINKSPLRELFSNRNHRRGLFILLCLKATQFLAGKMVISAYTQEIFGYTDSTLAPEHCVMILGGIDFIAGLVVGGVIERFSRKILLLTSGILTSLCLFICGLFFYLKNQVRLDVTDISWIPLFGLVVYMFAYTLGIGTIPYMVLGEIFPISVKGTAVSIGLMMGSIFSFLVTLTYSYVNHFAGIHTNFWIYAACSFIGAIVNFKLTPETKGKTLEEIQTMLQT